MPLTVSVYLSWFITIRVKVDMFEMFSTTKKQQKIDMPSSISTLIVFISYSTQTQSGLAAKFESNYLLLEINAAARLPLLTVHK